MRLSTLTLRLFLVVLVGASVCSASGKTRKKKVRCSLPGDISTGVSLGDPSGFTAKHLYTGRRGVDVALGVNLDGNFQFNGDFLYHFPCFLPVKRAEFKKLFAYIIVGGKIYFFRQKSEEDLPDDPGTLKMRPAARAGAGLGYWRIRGYPVEIFFELVPTIDLAPGMDIGMDVALGARYYFPF